MWPARGGRPPAGDLRALAEIAQTLVTVGIDLSLVVSAGDLQGGIELAERHLG